jgi:hypothetical protein
VDLSIRFWDTVNGAYVGQNPFIYCYLIEPQQVYSYLTFCLHTLRIMWQGTVLSRPSITYKYEVNFFKKIFFSQKIFFSYILPFIKLLQSDDKNSLSTLNHISDIVAQLKVFGLNRKTHSTVSINWFPQKKHHYERKCNNQGMCQEK